MFKSMKYVLQENLSNLYRIYTISRYTIVADLSDSNLGLFWKFANPTINVLTYWFLFGFVFARKDVDGYTYLCWMISGMSVWFFINPCITNGCNSIFSKSNVISKMKFPVSILPATQVMEEFFNHACFLVIVLVVMCFYGYYPSIYWFGLIYYMFAAICFGISIAMVLSVLNMLARDTRKFMVSIMRLLLYLTPILWNIKLIHNHVLLFIFHCNPIYYIVCGYRDCFLYHYGFLHYWKQALVFWFVTFVLFAVGSKMMYYFKTKFIDLL